MLEKIREFIKNIIINKKAEKLFKNWPIVKTRNNADVLNFVNGGGYLQLKKDFYKKKLYEFLKLVKEQFPKVEVDSNKLWYIGRVLDDSDSALYYFWAKLICVDKKYRYWGQPYYALHPERGKQKRIRIKNNKIFEF